MTCCDQYREDEPVYQCRKHLVTMCGACLKCKDPDLYCKFRTSCLIHFLEKEQRLAARRTATRSM